MARTICIVEDEPAIRDNYADLFRRQGYQVQTFANRPEAQAAFAGPLPDLVLLDIGLEDEVDGGFTLCRQLRGRSETLPIIFLTARDGEIDTVSGLRLGADDYVTKDVTLDHLGARVAALFRRIDAQQAASQASHSNQLTVGELQLDIDRLKAFWRSQEIPLTVTEIWILHALVRHPGHVRSRGQLMEAANTYVDDDTITSHIKRLRKKFVQYDPDFDAIESVYGAGYRWKRT